MARTAKPKRSFADIDAARKRYDPEVEGYGSAQQWNSAFYERMGVKEAESILYGSGATPRSILGVSIEATWGEIATAYRQKAMQTHPDRIAVTGMALDEATEAFKVVSAAYALLCREFGK
jgi:DnaJ-class molecular chaperone